MKIALYSPYLHILGGGERYLLSIAETLSRKHDVFLFSDESVKEKARSFFNISLDRIQFLPSKIFRTKYLFKKYTSLLSFDIFFYMTDGSLFFSTAMKNFLIIQSPAHIPKLSFLNKVKLKQWKILCYSKFIQRIISQRLTRKSFILPPSVEVGDQCHPVRMTSDFKSKKNIILTVGRFFPFPHNKKQDFLLRVFKKHYKKYFSNWKLVIAGGLTEKGGKEMVNTLRKENKGLPVDILVNILYSQLEKLYSQAKIYWHAAGFEEDLEENPERAEHFGITTLEAMMQSVVPVVYNGGGQNEIVEEGKSGYLWDSEEELIKKSIKLIKDKTLLSNLAKGARDRAMDFSPEKFYEKLEKVIGK